MTGRDEDKRNNAMPEFVIETPALRQALATALAFASGDVPSINVVHIKPTDDGAGIEIAATDRYVLSVEALNVTGETFEFSIPQDVAKQLLTVLPRPGRGALLDSMTTIAKDGEKVTVRLVGDVETAVTFTPPDESQPGLKFVNYRELMDKAQANKSTPADVMAFNPPILSRVCKTLAARDRHTPLKLHFGGAVKPVFVQQDTLTVLVMPVRITEQEVKAAKVAA
jgi:hypothetical protein